MFSDQDVVSCCAYLDGLFPEIPVFDITVNKEVDIVVVICLSVNRDHKKD